MTLPPPQSSPLRDLEAWRGQQRSEVRILITPDLAAMAQSGVSVALAARGPDGRPIVGVGIGCRVLPDGAFRVLLQRMSNRSLIEAVEAGSPIAVTFTGAPDHRAFQIKASGGTIDTACVDDIPELDRQCALFGDGLVEIGFSPRLAAGYVAYDRDDLVALRIVPERVFTQTPGPGAGVELSA